MRSTIVIARLTNFVNKGILAGIIAVIVSAIGNGFGFFENTDQSVSNVQYQLATKPVSSQTVIVGIDRETLAHFGGHPIGRKNIAKGLDAIAKAGAKRLFLDFSLSTEHSEEHDTALEQSLKELGPERVAIPMKILEDESAGIGGGQFELLEPYERFAELSTLVMANIPFDSDGLIRTIGAPGIPNRNVPGNVALWLATGEKRPPCVSRVDFRIDANSIPMVSFLDVANGNVNALSAIRDKIVVVGIVAPNVIDSVPTPRFHRMNRTRFIALAAETAIQKSQQTTSPQLTVIAFVLVVSISLGFVLSQCNMLVGILITTLLEAATFLIGVELQRATHFIPPFMIPFSSFALTFVGTQVAVNPLFAQTRNAIMSFVGKMDNGLAKLFHSNVDSIITFSPEGRILTINETAEKLFNLRSDQVVGKSLATILPGSADALLRAAAANKPGRIEATVENQSGSNRHVDLAFNSVPMESGWVGFASIRDISEFRAREEELKRQATHDALTGIPNRLAFEQHLDKTFVQSSSDQSNFAVFLLDLNKFKQVNDTLGHHIGDALLVEVASRLRKNIRQTDFVARLGGDEFAIVIAPGATPECTEHIASKLVEAIYSIKQLEGHAIESGTSIGVAFYPTHAQSTEDLVRIADEAMYEAKRSKTGYKIAAPQPV